MKKTGFLLSCASLAVAAAPLFAQNQPANAGAASTGQLDLATSQNATVNLIRHLVERNIITHEAAVDLIRQAEQEARMARLQSEAVTTAAGQLKAAAEAEIKASESDIRVTYVPDNIRAEIAADVRNELAARQRREALALEKTPSWTDRIHPFFDFRARYNNINFDGDNDTSGAFPDFNAINTGSPYDLSDYNKFYPTYNADQNRERIALRVRAGFEADLLDGFTFGMRVATGSGASPVSTNQTVGDPGNFSKYSLWLDQAFLSWESPASGDWGAKALVGRFTNPFFKTELTWDDDVQLDGLAISGTYNLGSDSRLFSTAGIFPIFNSSFNFPANQPDKFSSNDRYLSAVQLGFDTSLTKKIRVKAGVAYYFFDEIEGAPSDPVVPLSSSDAGSTDGRRPTFAQKGNTYMPLRDIPAVAANDFGTSNQWQYYGLASKFRPVVGTLRVDFDHFEPFQLTFISEFVKNTAYDVNRYSDRPAFAPIYFGGGGKGGDTGYLVGLRFGHAALQKPGDWRAGLDYRYIESDAFVDGFVDSDFGLGGTNQKGFTLSAQFALSSRVFLGARWLSASEIEGAPLRSDYFQIDINSKF